MKINIWEMLQQKTEKKLHFCPNDGIPLIHRPDLGAGLPEKDRRFVWYCLDCMTKIVIREEKPSPQDAMSQPKEGWENFS